MTLVFNEMFSTEYTYRYDNCVWIKKGLRLQKKIKKQVAALCHNIAHLQKVSESKRNSISNFWKKIPRYQRSTCFKLVLGSNQLQEYWEWLVLTFNHRLFSTCIFNNIWLRVERKFQFFFLHLISIFSNFKYATLS